MSVGKSLLRVTVAALAAALVPVSAAGARVRTSGTLDFPNTQVAEHTGIAYDYTTSNVPRGVRVSLQRQFGTSRVYRDIITLKKRAAKGTAPGLPMGRFGYRLAFWRGRKLLGATGPIFIYSFGEVTLAQLCQSSAYSIGNCSSGTVQVGSSVFSYQAADQHGNSSGNGAAELSAHHSTCRSGSISYALANDADPSAEADVQVTQSSADPQTDATPYGTASTLKFVLSSPAWDITFWENPAGPTVYWNGTFSCWTATGQ